MTDEPTMTDDETQAQPQMPEMTSYMITAQRQFELDFSENQLQALMQQTGTDNPENAIEQAFMSREKENVEPEQKLMGVNVQAAGPSDD